MEDIIPLSYPEHKILHTHKKKLESRYKVEIRMPDLQEPEFCATQETIIVTIVGDRQSIGFVQRFINRKLESMKNQDNNQSVVILDSDLEGDSVQDSVLSENKACKPKRKKRRRLETAEIDLTSTAATSENHSPVCEVTSTTNADESIIIIDTPPVEEFISISSNKTKKKAAFNPKALLQEDDDIVVISSDEDAAAESVPAPIAIKPRRLRPVVIDGSNVARSHGKPQNTFSCKGIKICVDYFLEKGHTQVTAFVPLYRRHCKRGPILTTDQEILGELEKTGHVVFTPSRRVDGRQYTCYDDRFIVQLAASNGGVILSNDNYKDLLDESPAFAETIKNRLLMYCFVGDMLMIPKDPLGSQGPKLEEYLSFPPNDDNS